MGGAASAAQGLTPEELDELQAATTFDKKQLQRLWKRFNLLDRTGDGKITREEFRLLPELAGNPLADRILDCLEPTEAEDADRQDILEHSGEVDFRMFVRTLDIFCSATAPRRKLEMLFKMYDFDSDGKLSHGDLRTAFQRVLGASVTSAQIESMVKATLSFCDEDGDDTLSLDEFSNMIDEDELHSRMTLAI